MGKEKCLKVFILRHYQLSWFKNCGDWENRTPDLVTASHTLQPTELNPQRVGKCNNKMESFKKVEVEIKVEIEVKVEVKVKGLTQMPHP